jgi:hypothetical protein
MRRVIAIESPDGSFERFESGKLITFRTVSEAAPWRKPSQQLKPVNVPDDHADALVSRPVHQW